MKKKIGGHNLLEVIIATMIFATVVILFLGTWSSFYTAMGISRNRLAATNLARAVLEQHVASGFSACVTDGIVSLVESQAEVRSRSASCDFRYQFYAVDSILNPSFRKLSVNVVWHDTAGDKVVTYETYLYRTN